MSVVAVTLTEDGAIIAALDASGALGPDSEPSPNGFDDLLAVREALVGTPYAPAFARLVARWAAREVTRKP